MTEQAVLNAEAKILASRLCLAHGLVVAWMKDRKIVAICDLLKIYPGKTHDEAMGLALSDIWAFALA